MNRNSLKAFIIISAVFCLFSCKNPTPAIAQYSLANAFPNLTFSSPLDLRSLPDGSNRFIVVQQKGKIFIVANVASTSTKKIFLDISSKVVQNGGEMGLLGCAIHPNFSQNHYIYVNYTSLSGSKLTSYISRFTASGLNLDTVLPATELILLTVDQPYQNHNGGSLAFGNDGYLYAGFGDGGSAGDPQKNGQNKSVFLGKILRVDVDNPSGGQNYSIPATNPFKSNIAGFKEEIYAYGVRNPWKFSFDRPTGKLWCADVGQDTWEEVDTIELGKNYGWNIMEADECFNPSTNCDQTGLTLPITQYPHNGGGRSITGGYVYHGNARPELKGKYIYADYVTGQVWALTDGPTTTTEELISGGANISAFGVLPDGELVALDIGGGTLLVLTAPTSVGTLPVKGNLAFNFINNPTQPNSAIILSVDASVATSLSFTMFDELGKQLPLQSPQLSSDKATFQLRLLTENTLTSGIYFLRATDGKTVTTKKLIVE